MGYRTIYFSEPCRLRLQDNSLIVERKEQSVVSVPLDDIDTIVVETLYATISTSLLSQISEKSIALVICDELHMPNGILLPSANCRHYKVARQQLSISDKLKKEIWHEILKQKLTNQASVLERFGFNNEAKKASGYAQDLDSPYIEGYVASLYFEKLFPGMIRRSAAVDARDLALNYGYMVLRAVVARSVVASGLMTAFGVFHNSQLNAFNLCDDLIESFRQVVDIVVFEIFSNSGDYEIFLGKDHKTRILEILSQEICVDGKMLTTVNAIEVMCQSFVKRIFLESKTLKLPIL